MALPSIFTRRPRLTRGVLTFALAAVLGLAYWMVWYGDVSEAIDKQRQKEVTLRADLAKAKESELEYHKDLAELTSRQQRQRELNKILPEATEYPAFLSALQGVANVAGVQLQGYSPQEEVAQKFFARIPMRLVLLGKFHQIARFFHGVGQLDRIINIENISLARPAQRGEDVDLKVECVASAFHTLPASARPAQGAQKP